MEPIHDPFLQVVIWYLVIIGDVHILSYREAIDDEFFNGNEFQFSYLYTDDDLVDTSPGQVITINCEGIDQQFNDYMELLLDVVDNDGPFSTTPVLVRGNIVHPTNTVENPLGYFRISEVFGMSITVVED